MISLYFLANILSLFVNIILLFVSAYYAKIKVNWYRVFVAALIQCILNHMLHLIDSNDQFMMFITLLSGAVCSLVAYIIDSNYIRGICIYTLMHTVIMILSVTFIDNVIINLFAVVFCVVLIKKLSNHYCYDSKNIVDIEIKHNNSFVKLRALRDTGNLLIDPLTGCSVILIGTDATEKLLGLNKEQIADPIRTLSENILPGLRLMPYKTIGLANGMLLAYKFKDVRIGAEQGSRLVAFVPEGFSSEYEFQALTGGE